MKSLGSITALGVRRPVLITVFNLLILLAGLASLMGVDVRELPDVDRPIVGVRATFQGASPETMDSEVTSIIEGAVARVSGVKSIESSSEENNMRMRVEFAPSMDIDTAANDVREAVSRIQRELPEDIDQVLVIKSDDDADPVIQLSAQSKILSSTELARRIEQDVTPELMSIPGIADVRLDGLQPRELHVRLDPAKLASFDLGVHDVIDVLQQTRFDVPAGSYRSEDQEILVRAYASVIDPQKVEELYVTRDVRLKDIGQAFFAPQEAESYALLNGRLVIGLGIIRQAGSNTISIADEVENRLEDINARSKDYQLNITANNAVFIKGALKEVIITLCFAILIVLVVIALFLGQWRAVLVPAVTMPIALIGTVAAIWLFGFSINLLTLLALVLATGLIVDDAIVVLENIQRRRAQGLPKMAAAVLGTEQVFFAVIATTITLVAVFLPVAFLPGDTGRLFREFGLVLAIAVVISSFVAITLCPMIASRLPHMSESSPRIQRIQDTLNAWGQAASAFYFKTLEGFLRHKKIFLLTMLGLMITSSLAYFGLTKELLPEEDRGTIYVSLTGPDGASLKYADSQAQKVEKVLLPYQEQGVIEDIYSIIGRWDKNRAFIIATLAPWKEREMPQQQLANQLSNTLADFPGAQVRVAQPSSLNVRGGGSGGIEVAVLGNDYQEIAREADKLAYALIDEDNGISDVRVEFDTSQPEISFNINREKANDLDVPLNRISQTLQVMVDEYDVLDLSIADEAVTLRVGSLRSSIENPADLLNVFVPNNSGDLIPLSALIKAQEQGVAAELDRYAQRRGIELDIALENDTSLGEAIETIRNKASATLPSNMAILFLGDAATYTETSYDVAITFILAFLLIFFVLAAQFESMGSALIVIFTVPFGLAAAVFALFLAGQSLNLYSQIGLVMLIGLMTKNAILLVEFMDQLRDEGHSIHDAIIKGVEVRLRPVMMTVFSTVLGSVPLLLSAGPGAEARNAIGWVIFGGLGLSTVFTLYLAPLGYSLFAPFTKARAHAGEKLAEELKQADEMEGRHV